MENMKIMQVLKPIRIGTITKHNNAATVSSTARLPPMQILNMHNIFRQRQSS